MRVSNQMQNKMLSSQILENQESVYDQQRQIGSGKKINRASDDPAVWTQVSRLKQQQQELSQYAENAKGMESQLQALDFSLDAIGDVLRGVSELSVRAADSTLSGVNREGIAMQINALLDELVSQGNAKRDGKYLFSGSDTQTEPFTTTLNADGRVDSVSFVGGTFAATLEIAPGDAMPRQLIGGGTDGVFINSTANAFQSIINLRDQLLAGTNIAESGLQQEIDNMAESVLVDRASVGAMLEHIGFVKELHTSQGMDLTETISRLEDIDVAEAVTQLSAKQTAYEATLAMASKTLNMSLLNYL